MDINEIEELDKMIAMKNKAKELFEIISTKQKLSLFPNSKGRYVVWDDGNNQHYFVKEGGNTYWVADYLHQYYKILVSESGIFNKLVSAYRFDKDNKNTCYANNDMEAMRYFESYVRYGIDKQNIK